jgi:hypothetical protein
MGRFEFVDVDGSRLPAVHELFDSDRATRHCRCMAMCSTSLEFAAGWYGGGNRRRFDALARASSTPMGVLALIDGAAAGWISVGPRSRYVAALRHRSRLLAGLPRAEDETAWLIACLFIARAHRDPSLTMGLVRAAVTLAERSGAAVIDAWPVAVGVREPGLDHVGRERLFARAGFAPISRPDGRRVIMRRTFAPRSGSASPRLQ